MATVTGYTAAKMDEIADTCIVDGNVVSGNLILEQRDGTNINAGSVVGPSGGSGPAGPSGPTAIVGTITEQDAADTVKTSSFVMSGLEKNNVPVVINHTYGVRLAMSINWASIGSDGRWDVWARLNGVNYERFRIIKPATPGISTVKLNEEVFWKAPATASTDDWTVYFEHVVTGATVEPLGASTHKRRLWLVDYGVGPL